MYAQVFQLKATTITRRRIAALSSVVSFAPEQYIALGVQRPGTAACEIILAACRIIS